MKKIILMIIGVLLILTESVGIAQYEIVDKKKKVDKVSKNYTFLDAQKQIQCLALNIYFEAANQSTAGQLAVANVTYNRAKSKDFPNTFCDVVYESKRDNNNNPIANKCQFSWYCDGKTDIPWEGEKWHTAKKLAAWYFLNRERIPDITDGSTHYHGNYIKYPYWSRHYARTVSIDNHIFYRNY